MSRPGEARRLDGAGRRSHGNDPAGFTPASLSGLILWLRSDLGITLAVNKVAAWADQSGNGNDFATGVDADRPVYAASDALVGGQPSLTFTAAMGGLLRADFGLGLANMSVGVFYRRTVAGIGGYIGPIPPSNSAALTYSNGATGFDGNLTNAGGANTVRDTTDALNTKYSRIVTYPIGTAGAVDPILYTNGVATGSAVSSTATDSAVGSATWRMGYSLDGLMTEVFAYNRILTAPEAAQLAAYQMARYA